MLLNQLIILPPRYVPGLIGHMLFLKSSVFLNQLSICKTDPIFSVRIVPSPRFVLGLVGHLTFLILLAPIDRLMVCQTGPNFFSEDHSSSTVLLV